MSRALNAPTPDELAWLEAEATGRDMGGLGW